MKRKMWMIVDGDLLVAPRGDLVLDNVSRNPKFVVSLMFPCNSLVASWYYTSLKIQVQIFRPACFTSSSTRPDTAFLHLVLVVHPLLNVLLPEFCRAAISLPGFLPGSSEVPGTKLQQARHSEVSRPEGALVVQPADIFIPAFQTILSLHSENPFVLPKVLSFVTCKEFWRMAGLEMSSVSIQNLSTTSRQLCSSFPRLSSRTSCCISSW